MQKCKDFYNFLAESIYDTVLQFVGFLQVGPSDEQQQ